MREISGVRTTANTNKVTPHQKAMDSHHLQSQQAYAPIGGVPQLKPVNRPLNKGGAVGGNHHPTSLLQRDVSERSLGGVIAASSARDPAL